MSNQTFDYKAFDQAESFHRLRYLFECHRSKETPDVYLQLLYFVVDTIWGELENNTSIDLHFRELMKAIKSKQLTLNIFDTHDEKIFIVNAKYENQLITYLELKDFGEHCDCWIKSEGLDEKHIYTSEINSHKVTFTEKFD